MSFVMRKCPTCQEDLPSSAFSRSAGGRARQCRDCKNAAARARHAKLGPAEIAKRRQYAKAWSWLKRYGLTPSDYAELLQKQDGACAICGATSSEDNRALAVDHCHASGRVRGLLCRSCNRALGGFKESPDLLLVAAKYVAGGGAPAP